MTYHNDTKQRWLGRFVSREVAEEGVLRRTTEADLGRGYHRAGISVPTRRGGSTAVLPSPSHIARPNRRTPATPIHKLHQTTRVARQQREAALFVITQLSKRLEDEAVGSGE